MADEQTAPDTVPPSPVPVVADDAATDTAPFIDLDGQPPIQRRRRRMLPVLVAAGTTLAVLLGVGAYVAYQRLVVGGRPTEEFTPATVAAYAAVDLMVGGDQRAKLADVLGKLDTGAPSGGNAANSLKRMLERLHLDNVDIDRDVMSWLGPRLAVSLWFDGARAYGLISASATNDGRARAGLDRIKAAKRDLGFVIDRGAVLIAIGEDAQRAAETAASQARTSPLDGLASFQEARRWLGGGYLITLWTDMGRYTEALTSQMTREGVTQAISIPSERGTSIAGIRATEDGFEARYRSFGSSQKASPLDDAVARLAALPANTELGVALTVPANPRSTLGLAMGPYGGPFGLLTGGLLFGLMGPLTMAPPSEDPFEKLTEAERKEVDKLLAKDPRKLTDAESKRLKDLMGFSPKDMAPPGGDPFEKLTEAERKEVDKLLAKDPSTLTDAESKRLKDLIGFSPKDITTDTTLEPGIVPGMEVQDPFRALAGATMTVALSGFGGRMQVRMVAEAPSADAAQAIVGMLGTSSNGPPDVKLTGNVVTMTTPTYVAGPGRLDDDPAFRRLTAAVGGRTEMALYANLGGLLRDQRFRVLKVGLVQSVDNGDHVGMVRLVVG